MTFHDDVSSIHIPKQSGSETLRWIWDYLVPLSGKAQTAQGEVIRIAGRVNIGIMGNSGMNWDGDYRKILCILPEYLCLRNSLKDEDIAQVEKITGLLRNGRDAGNLTLALCAYAAVWVSQNPEMFPLLEADR